MSVGPLKTPLEICLEVLATTTIPEMNALAAGFGLPPQQDRRKHCGAFLNYVLAADIAPPAPFDEETTRVELNTLTTPQLVSVAKLFGFEVERKSRAELLNGLVKYFMPPE